ncbi:hypothetical protein F5Y10DRAFT_242743 [Nemania abortiva]|nr:hypothetical protein F5Y10DRAFT_242743 [Nemania abortiva]
MKCSRISFGTMLRLCPWCLTIDVCNSLTWWKPSFSNTSGSLKLSNSIGVSKFLRAGCVILGSDSSISSFRLISWCTSHC